MTVAAGRRIRITAPGLYCGQLGMVVKRTVISGDWVVTLDMEVWPGRHGWALADDDELEAVDAGERIGEGETT